VAFHWVLGRTPFVISTPWVIRDDNGKSYLKQHLSPDARPFAYPIFVTGDSEWSDYTVEAKVKPLSYDGMAGICSVIAIALHLPLEKALRVRQWSELGSANFSYDKTHYLSISRGKRWAAHSRLRGWEAAHRGH
jgi:hypothetical protein